MSKRHEQSFFQRRYANAQQAHKKMFNVFLVIREMETKSMRCHFTPISMAIIRKRKLKNNKSQQDVERMRSSYIAGGNVKWCRCCGKVLQVHSKLSTDSSYGQRFHSQIQTQKDRKLVHKCSQWHYSLQPKGGNLCISMDKQNVI